MDLEAGAAGTRRPAFQKSLVTSWIWAFAVGVVLLFLIGGRTGTLDSLLIGGGLAAVGGAITFYILRSGKLNSARWLLFIGTGLFFGIAFTLEHQVNRGSILLSPTIIQDQEVPICPITIPFVLPPYYIRGEMIFPTSAQAIMGIVLFWFGLAWLFGRGWCSWLCFFGGIDQFFASLAKKPLIKTGPLSQAGRLFPYAFLLFLILLAVAALYPLFCAWICPLRIVYDPPTVNSTSEWLTSVIFVTGGMAFLIVGPYVTKKRLFCSLLCPLLPVNSLLGKLSPFQVKIDPSRCNKCGKCALECEMFAVTPESAASGSPHLECSRCGRCIDQCPSGAIDFYLIGTRDRIRPVFVSLAVIFNILLTGAYITLLVQYLRTGTFQFFQ